MAAAAKGGDILATLHARKPQIQDDINFFSRRNIGHTENVNDWVITNYHLLVVFILSIFEASNLTLFAAVKVART